MLTGKQFLFFNKVTLMPPKKASTQPKGQLCRIIKNYELTGIPTTSGNKYPKRSCSVSQKNTTSEDSVLLVSTIL
jgi:hypothetical protein